MASSNDPWVRFTTAAYWASCWASRLIEIGPAGHINSEAGYGPWPQGLALLHALMAASHELPLGTLADPERRPSQGRSLARLRHYTRRSVEAFVPEAP